MQKTPPITRGRKFSQVLEGARLVFLRDGFEGASVDDIAREAGVSKATLYSYFPDKRLMFMEVFRSELQREAADANALVDIDLPVQQVLPFVIQMIANHLVSEFGVRVFRLSVGEADRFPVLAQEYYESGLIEATQRLIVYFELCVARGELVIDDLELAANQLLRLAGTIIHEKALLLGRSSITTEDLQRIGSGAVRMFLLAYGSPAVRDQVLAQEQRPIGHSTAAE